MRNRKNRQHRDQTRNPATRMTGDYVFHVETIAVRLIGKKGSEQERAYITGSVEGERELRRFEVPVYFSNLARDNRDPKHLQLLDNILDATDARDPKDAIEGPNPYAFDDDGTGLGLPIGAYRVAKKNSAIFLRIAQKEGNKFQRDVGQTDSAGYVNSIIRVVDTE